VSGEALVRRERAAICGEGVAGELELRRETPQEDV
jgi:hypothetical protein